MKTYALAANGSTATFTPPMYDDLGVTLEVSVTGTFGGGNVILEQTPDGSNWFQCGTPITAKARQLIPVYSGSQLRLTLAGATSPSLALFVTGGGL